MVANRRMHWRQRCRSSMIKFVADEISATCNDEREQDHNRNCSLCRGCGRHNERAFHPAGDRDDEQKAACPNRAVETALSAEDVEEEEQSREQQKAHKLFHVYHPWTGLRQKSEPSWLRAEQKIRCTHPGSDRNEHR